MDDLKGHIAKLREDFVKGNLSEKDVQKHPFAQFKLWLDEAVEAKVPEVQAMNLATVSHDGKPSARIVYLREFDDNQFWFYTNYNSKKAGEIEKNPYAALTFFWPELERQIRIEGRFEKASPFQSDAYFNARPYESKIGAWASQQSKVLKSRAELEEKIAERQKQYGPETIKRPSFWGGYVLTANYYEFWQGRKNRLHDRISYTLENENWIIARLSP
jgi:pyridoxamine 5'-phosphate oxidase